MICGVEIIARRIVRVLLRSWVAPLDAERAAIDRPFFGVYLPAHAANRQATQRSLIGPDDRLMPGGMVELDTGNARYLVRFNADDRAPGRLVVGAVQRGAQALRLTGYTVGEMG